MDRETVGNVLCGVRAGLTVLALAGVMLLAVPLVAHADATAYPVTGSGNTCSGQVYENTLLSTALGDIASCTFTVPEGMTALVTIQVPYDREGEWRLDSGTWRSVPTGTGGSWEGSEDVAEAGSHTWSMRRPSGAGNNFHVGPNYTVTTSPAPTPSPTPTPTATAPNGALYAEGSMGDPGTAKAVGLAVSLMVFLGAAGLTRGFSRGSRAA